jgi:hypothetical protein
MLGRGLRIMPGKKDCKVLDFTDKHHQVCTYVCTRPRIYCTCWPYSLTYPSVLYALILIPHVSQGVVCACHDRSWNANSLTLPGCSASDPNRWCLLQTLLVFPCVAMPRLLLLTLNAT